MSSLRIRRLCLSALLLMGSFIASTTPVVRASLPYPDIALTRTVYSVGESVAIRIRILTMPGVPTPISGLRLVFNTPAGVMTYNIETINSDTWYTSTVSGVTKVPGTCTVIGQLPVYGTSSSTLTFTVKEAEDFSVSASPTSITLKQGEQASLTVNVSPVGGFDKSVSLSVTGLPSGMTAVFNAPSGKPPLASTLTISVLPSTPEGNYSLTIQASGDSKIRSARVALRVDKNPSLLERMLLPVPISTPFGPILVTPLLLLGTVIAVAAIAVVFFTRKSVGRRSRPSTAGRLPPPPPPPPPLASMEKKYCLNCGAQIPRGAAFCRRCGSHQR